MGVGVFGGTDAKYNDANRCIGRSICSHYDVLLGVLKEISSPYLGERQHGIRSGLNGWVDVFGAIVGRGCQDVSYPEKVIYSGRADGDRHIV